MEGRQPARHQRHRLVIRRRLPGETALSFLGVTGEKRFTDETLPPGAERVEYTVQGQRGKRSGPLSEILAVTIGKDGLSGEGATGNASASRDGIANRRINDRAFLRSRIIPI